MSHQVAPRVRMDVLRRVRLSWKSRGLHASRISRQELLAFVDEIGGLTEWNLATVRRWFPTKKLSRAAFARIDAEIGRVTAKEVCA